MGVILDGVFDDNLFLADDMLVKHDNEYVSSDGETYNVENYSEMIYNLGILISWLSFLVLIYLFFTESNYRVHLLVRINLFLQIFLFCLLEIGLFLNDFSVSYIANYSAVSTPPLYKFASLWGSLDGSILLWNLCLSIFMFFYLKYYKIENSNLDIKIFSFITIFLLVIQFSVPLLLRDVLS